MFPVIGDLDFSGSTAEQINPHGDKAGGLDRWPDVVSTRRNRAAFERALVARLTAGGKLDDAAVERALRLRDSTKERLEQILTKLGLVHEREVGLDPLERREPEDPRGVLLREKLEVAVVDLAVAERLDRRAEQTAAHAPERNDGRRRKRHDHLGGVLHRP